MVQECFRRFIEFMFFMKMWVFGCSEFYFLVEDGVTDPQTYIFLESVVKLLCTEPT